MRISNDPQTNPHPVDGTYQPEVLWGTGAPDALSTFTTKNIGTEYWRYVTANHVQRYVKAKNDGTANDWVLNAGIIHQTITRAQFTDGGSTSGTKALNGTIPVGAYLEKANVRDLTGFTGDTSATILISGGVDITTDTDGYMTGTPSVFTTATAVVVGVPSGVRTVTTAGIPVVTVTSAADFTNVVAGSMTITLFYKV